MNKRILIVNADDFGMRQSINEAVAALYKQGGITSTTLLAPAALAEEACTQAAQNRWPAGVHWTLHSEWAGKEWPACGGASTLTDKEGLLLADAKAMAKAAKGRDVTRELEVQVQFMVQRGCPPTHADSHGGTLYGTNGRLFFLSAFKVCKKYNLPFRFAKTDGFLRRQMDGNVPAVLKAAHRAVVLLAGAFGVRLLDNFVTNPHPAAKVSGYEELCQYYETELAKAPAGVTEVFMHPALPDEEMQRRTPEWQKRLWEFEYLSSGRFAAFAQKEGFELAGWEVLRR